MGEANIENIADLNLFSRFDHGLIFTALHDGVAAIQGGQRADRMQRLLKAAVLLAQLQQLMVHAGFQALLGVLQCQVLTGDAVAGLVAQQLVMRGL